MYCWRVPAGRTPSGDSESIGATGEVCSVVWLFSPSASNVDGASPGGEAALVGVAGGGPAFSFLGMVSPE